MADWITIPIGERCPGAETCLDPFHIVKLSTDALDEVRRRVWNDTRKAGQRGLARELKGARFALWMNPGAAHRTTPAEARPRAGDQQEPVPRLPHRQQLRMIYRVPCPQALELLEQ